MPRAAANPLVPVATLVRATCQRVELSVVRRSSSTGLTIIGGGPAGIGLLVAAANSGQLPSLFARGVTVLERGADVGAGELGGYDINSDSHADSFLRCLDAGLGERFPALLAHPAARALQDYRSRTAPLPLIADFVAAIARAFQALAAGLSQPILTGTQALIATRMANDQWTLRVRRVRDGAETDLVSRHLAIATGAEPSSPDLRRLRVAGQAVWPRHNSKLVLSRAVLTTVGLRVARRLLAETNDPRVAIIGSSHSALSAVNALLSLSPGVNWTRGSITVLHRKPLRPMYQTPELARAEGFHAFADDDICPKTGRVFPLAGFRSDSRDLLLSIMGLGGRAPEDRVQLIDVGRCAPRRLAGMLERAHLIVAATGYRPRALPLFDRHGRRIALLSEGSGDAAMVDGQSRVLDRVGRPVPGVFGIGLSAGFPLAGTHGEPSFRGQANGLALWHGEIGAAIVRAVLEEQSTAPALVEARVRRDAHSPVGDHVLQPGH